MAAPSSDATLRGTETLLRCVRHAVVLGYLAFFAVALLAITTNVQLPHGVDFIIRVFQKSAIAFESYETHNALLTAEGKNKEGNWVSIDIDDYLPQSMQKKIQWWNLNVYTDNPSQYYTVIAKKLYDHENAKGNSYNTVRLYMEQWPKSRHGYDAFYRGKFIQRQSLAQYPTNP